MKKKITTILLMLVFAVGLSLLLYPTVSDFWNSLHATRVVASYDNLMSSTSKENFAAIIEAAREYNETLLTNPNRFLATEEESEAYVKLLAVAGTDAMGYIEIPKIGVKLPIYHGTDEAALQVGVGHIIGSSLPIGGESAHSALSGHTGLPSAKLLTDMDQLEVGDMFYLHIFGDVLVYQIDETQVVEPDNIEPLAIVPGKDYSTLVTCTPYGINSHRLLARGVRVPQDEFSQMPPTNDAEPLHRLVGMALVAVPVFLICLILYLIISKRK